MRNKIISWMIAFAIILGAGGALAQENDRKKAPKKNVPPVVAPVPNVPANPPAPVTPPETNKKPVAPVPDPNAGAGQAQGNKAATKAEPQKPEDLLDPEIAKELADFEKEVAELDAKAKKKQKDEANAAAKEVISALKAKKAAREAELAAPSDPTKVDKTLADGDLIAEEAVLEKEVADLDAKILAKAKEAANASARERIAALKARRDALLKELGAPAVPKNAQAPVAPAPPAVPPAAPTKTSPPAAPTQANPADRTVPVGSRP